MDKHARSDCSWSVFELLPERDLNWDGLLQPAKVLFIGTFPLTKSCYREPIFRQLYPNFKDLLYFVCYFQPIYVFQLLFRRQKSPHFVQIPKFWPLWFSCYLLKFLLHFGNPFLKCYTPQLHDLSLLARTILLEIILFPPISFYKCQRISSSIWVKLWEPPLQLPQNFQVPFKFRSIVKNCQLLGIFWQLLSFGLLFLTRQFPTSINCQFEVNFGPKILKQTPNL